MTDLISLERSKTPKYIFYHCLLLKNYVGAVIDKFMTRVHLKNIYTIIGALTFDTKIILVSILSVLVVIIYYVSFESLKPQNSSCVNCFEIRHCITIEIIL